MNEFSIEPISASDLEWMRATLTRHWESHLIASRGRLIDASALPGYVAVAQAERIGLVTYELIGRECEIVSLNSFRENCGVGSALIAAVQASATEAGCERLWLITTNDNVEAIRFYLKRGMRLAAVHRDALEESRKLKPSIPLIGDHGLPLLDELEFEIRLG
jgi:ribosomal protein S18 acetylase RimI-like enzyme